MSWDSTFRTTARQCTRLCTAKARSLGPAVYAPSLRRVGARRFDAELGWNEPLQAHSGRRVVVVAPRDRLLGRIADGAEQQRILVTDFPHDELQLFFARAQRGSGIEPRPEILLRRHHF